MSSRVREDLARIGLSFIRAFVGATVMVQATNVNDLRGVTGFLLSAAVAGIAAGLRTAETILSKRIPDSDV